MLNVEIYPQPTQVTCGPTSLHAIYQYYGDSISLEQVIKEVAYVPGGGTLAVLLGCHALTRGYKATIYTYNLRMFDPSWFSEVSGAEHNQYLLDKLAAQLKVKHSLRQEQATAAYSTFLELGGKIKFEDLTPNLLSKYFRKKVPILSGLSATYLYSTARESAPDDFTTVFDDISGEPSGHFVVLCGYDEESHKVVVADPSPEHPKYNSQYYSVKIHRLINSIMLGILTHDANFLIIEKV